MKIAQFEFAKGHWNTIREVKDLKPTLILCFGAKNNIGNPVWLPPLCTMFPGVSTVSCSTAGEFSNTSISDNSIIATALQLEAGKIICHMINIKDYAGSFGAGKDLAAKFNKDGLRLCLVLSDGALVNGQDLVDGINSVLTDVPVSGGLAGDGNHFKSTLVGYNDNIKDGNVVAIGLYGDKLEIGFGSKGGWAEFGPTRKITKSEKNVLFEIDDAPALELYKRYLGSYAAELPGSALLFPLAMTDESGQTVVRTILSIDESRNSMTFAGNMPVGAQVRLMKTTLEDLAEAAAGAAQHSAKPKQPKDDSLAILISCVGRKAVFGARIDEEFDAVRSSLGNEIVLSGFYSYGEISPGGHALKCQLHNQTMTITTLAEF